VRSEGPRKNAATDTQIRDAYGALTPAQLTRLKKFADYRAVGLWPTQGDDLIQDALVATLSGERTWSRRIDFLRHLMGVVQSISSHKREALERRGALGSPEALPEEPLSPVPDPESEALERELETQLAQQRAHLEELYANDALLGNIFAGLIEGLPHEEIRDLLGLDETAYWSAVRKMKRWAVN
jgi:DNA-directed RNA polymerase specialized sigma24 family protein